MLVYVYIEKYKFLYTHTVYVVYLTLGNVYPYILLLEMRFPLKLVFNKSLIMNSGLAYS